MRGEESEIDGLCRAAQKSGLAVLWDVDLERFVQVNLEHLTPRPEAIPFTDADRLFLVWTNERNVNGSEKARRR